MNNIKAKVIAHSVTEDGIEMISIECEYPRFILAEVNTHKMLSKNSASSRAIPEAAMHSTLLNNPAMPVYWGANQSGMKAKEELAEEVITKLKRAWLVGRDQSMLLAEYLFGKGLHKQISNRVTEPWMMMKSIISGTEWRNLFWLRDHPDAQPEFAALARAIKAAIDNSIPELLLPGEWHVPYVETYRSPIDKIRYYYDEKGKGISMHEAIKVSASSCAQVSYRKNDATIDKAEKVYDMLNLDRDDVPKHASPVEHQATPINQATTVAFEPETWEPGVTHVTANGELWSGNLRGWIQYRKLIPGEAKW